MDEEERKRLLALYLQEARSRGVPIPKELFQPKVYRFPTDSRGYFSKLDGSLYKPTEQQEAFIASTARFVGFGGSRGSGKSGAGAQKALRKIMQGYSGGVLNADFENLKTSTWAEFREWIPWDMVVPAHRYRRNLEFDPHQQFRLAFLNGASVTVKGVKDPNSARGSNWNWIWYDEVQRDDTGLSWKVAIASVRVGVNPQVFATFTPHPSGKDHWAYKFFIEREVPEEAQKLFALDGGGEELIEFYRGTIRDNQANLDSGYFASMLAAYAGGGMEQRELYGEFVGDAGALGDRTWFNGKILSPDKLPDNISARVRFWDLAATEKKMTGKKYNDPDETIGTLESWNKYDFYIEDQVGGCFAWDDIKKLIVETAERDGESVKIFVEQEPASGGKNQVEELKSYVREKLPGHPVVVGYPPPHDRVICANTWFAEAKNGHVYLVYGDWNEKFLRQFASFPEGRHDDRITSASGARYNLAPIKTWNKMKFMHL
jgi:predicted phage terminase large subunit-like protein